jgi:hypothetical protein
MSVCKHISRHIEGRQPIVGRPHLYWAWDLQCAKCGKNWTEVLRMTPEQIKKDKEYARKYEEECARRSV